MLVVNEVSLSRCADQVHDLWRRNLSGMAHADPHAKMRLGYLENPAGKGAGIGLREEDAGPLAGVICLHRRSMYRGSSRLEAANMADFAVDVRFRTLGPALLLMKEAVSFAGKHALLLYGLPNRTSAAVCRRAGLNSMGEGLHRYACVLNGNHPITRHWLPPLACWLRPVLGLALRVVEAWRYLTLSPRLACEATSFADPAIDAIWDQRPSYLLLGERSAAMQRWRYGDDARGKWSICLARTRQGRAVGLLVWRLLDGIAEVGDFYCLDPSRQTASMLVAFCRFARAQGANGVRLEFFGATAVVDQIFRAGLRSRGEASMVVLDAAVASDSQVADAECWYLTAFDSDAN